MAIKFPGEITAPYKPETAESSGVGVSTVDGVAKYGEISGGVVVGGYLPLAGGTVTGNLNIDGDAGIGTDNTSLFAVYGATPVDQPAAIDDAATQDLTGADTVDQAKLEADLTSCKNTINLIIDRLVELGLIAEVVI
jgi:hypothetical protein